MRTYEDITKLIHFLKVNTMPTAETLEEISMLHRIVDEQMDETQIVDFLGTEYPPFHTFNAGAQAVKRWTLNK